MLGLLRSRECILVFLLILIMSVLVVVHTNRLGVQQTAKVWLGFDKSSRPRAVLHFGPHKTGSSSLQWKLCEKRDELERDGWIYPICPACNTSVAAGGNTCISKSFAGLAFELQGVDRSIFRCTESELQCLRDVLTAYPGQNIIMSSEELSKVSSDGLQKLYEALEDYDISLVYFWRNKADLAKSIYTELYYKNIPWKSFEEQLLDSMSDTMTGMPHLCPSVQSVLDVFGKNPQNGVELISFDRLVENGQHPFDFLAETILKIDTMQMVNEDDIIKSENQKSRRRLLADSSVMYNQGVDLATEALKNQIIKYYHIQGRDVKKFCPETVFKVAQEFIDEVKPQLHCYNLSRVFERLDHKDMSCVRDIAQDHRINFHGFSDDTVPSREGSGFYCLVSSESLKNHWHRWFAKVPEQRLVFCPPRKP